MMSKHSPVSIKKNKSDSENYFLRSALVAPNPRCYESAKESGIRRFFLADCHPCTHLSIFAALLPDILQNILIFLFVRQLLWDDHVQQTEHLRRLARTGSNQAWYLNIQLSKFHILVGMHYYSRKKLYCNKLYKCNNFK